MDLENNIFEISLVLIEEFSSKDSNLHKNIIGKFIEKRLVSKDTLQEDFETDLDWINTSKGLSFRKELKGKIVVLDFFTYCCINCMHVLPQLKALEHEFSIEDGLVVIGVHSPKFANERDTTNVRAAVSRYEISHPVVNDYAEHMWNSLGICCWPTLLIIGPNGELLLGLMGESHGTLLHSFVREALSLMKMREWISPHGILEIGVQHQHREIGPLSFPGKVCATKTDTGHLLAVADTGHHRVLILDNNGNILHAVGGKECGFKDGSFEASRFHGPQGLVFTDSSTLFVADTENHAIRKLDLEAEQVETVAGDGMQGDHLVGGGVGGSQRLSSPWDIVALSPSVLLIAMAGCHQIWAYFLQDTVFWRNKHYEAGSCAAVAGSGREENRNNAYPQSAGFAQPSGLTVAESRQAVYVADSESSSVRAVSATDGKVTPVVGGSVDPQNLFVFGDVDGSGTSVRLQHPLAVAWSHHKQCLYVCDSYNHKLKVVDPSSRHCATLVNNSLELNEPGGLCAVDNLLYIADTNNHCIKVLDVDNHSVYTMTIRLKKTDRNNAKTPQPAKEVKVLVRQNGVLELRVEVETAADVKPLADSPAEWTLSLPDGWREKDSSEGEGVGRCWTLAVAEAADEARRTDQLTVRCRLFYCHRDLCSVRTLVFLVSVAYSGSAPATESSSIKYVFSV